jgi:prepilin-type N-terminal cleavage/methylation domain-containing protein
MRSQQMSRAPRRRSAVADRAGFSFIELIVGLAIMLMVATVVTPIVAGAADRARIDTSKATLEGLAAAIGDFEDDVKEHPGSLHQLQRELQPGESNACGLTYRNGPGKGGTDTWDGPYINRELPSSGQLPLGIGTADDELVRVGEKTRSGDLFIVVRGVTPEDAEALDAEVDAGDGAAGGTIRWTPAGSQVVLQYAIPAPRC